MGDKVYDVSSFDHPGTVIVLLKSSDGQDALSQFNNVQHSKRAIELATMF